MPTQGLSQQRGCIQSHDCEGSLLLLLHCALGLHVKGEGELCWLPGALAVAVLH